MFQETSHGGCRHLDPVPINLEQKCFPLYPSLSSPPKTPPSPSCSPPLLPLPSLLLLQEGQFRGGGRTEQEQHNESLSSWQGMYCLVLNENSLVALWTQGFPNGCAFKKTPFFWALGELLLVLILASPLG